MPLKPDPETNQKNYYFLERFQIDFGWILVPSWDPGGSPEMLFGCPEGSWGYLGPKMVLKMVPRGPKRPPGDPETDFDEILIEFCQFFDRFLGDFWSIFV